MSHQFFLHIHFNTSFKYFFNLSSSKKQILNKNKKRNILSKYESIFNKISFKDEKKNFFLFNLKVPFLCLFNINIYLDSFYENINAKDLFFFCNFKFKNVKKSNNLFNCFTNSIW